MFNRRTTRMVEEPPSAAQCADAGVWHVVRTPPGRELETGRLLVDLGFTAWCPLQKTWRRVGRGCRVRKRNVARPAFIRYIFAGVPDPAAGGRRANWKAALEAGLVEAILARSDGRPVTLSPKEVRRLAERQGAGEFDEALARASAAAEMGVGARVRVVEGPFRGFEYRVESVAPASVRVLAVLLGAERFVDLALDQVVKAA